MDAWSKSNNNNNNNNNGTENAKRVFGEM